MFVFFTFTKHFIKNVCRQMVFFIVFLMIYQYSDLLHLLFITYN